MQLVLVSYNGTNLNDGTNYEAWFAPGQPAMPDASLEWAKRNRAYPRLAGKSLSGPALTLWIECRGTIHSQLAALEQLFAGDDYTTHELVAKDIADGDQQWYVKGYSAGPVKADQDTAGVYYVSLALEEPFWRIKPSSSDTWGVTATGQTKSLALAGNKAARPIIEITPTNPRAGGYAYKRCVVVYNKLDLPLANYKIELTGGGLDTAALVADTSVSNQVNQVGGITADATTIPIDTDVGGGLPAAGMGYVDTEQITWTGKSAGQLTGVTRGVGGTTPATHADNAVIARSKVLANGDDLRALVDGSETNLWLDAMNSAATRAWISANFKPRAELTLKTAISNIGTPATIDVDITSANLDALKRMNAKGLVLIGSELFTYSAINKTTYKLTVKKRSVNGTAAASHAAGSTVRWIQHVIWLVYGNYQASAPVTDDSLKPLFDLGGSMTSRTYNEFYDEDSLRSGWKPHLASALGPDSGYYTGSHEAFTDPATEMGVTIQAFEQSNVWKADTVNADWSLYDPAGFTTITVTGAKYRQLTSWPGTVACEVSNDGVKWARVFNEATPSSAAIWLALAAHSGVSLGGTYKYVRFHVKGSVSNIAGNKTSWEAQSVTLVLPSANVPSIALGDEIASGYYLEARLTNNSNGEYIDVACPMEINGTLTIDCDAQTAEFDDGMNALPYLTISRIATQEWLPLEPGVTNELQYDEAGVSAVTVDLSWEDRNTL